MKLYHVCQQWDEGNLTSLYQQHGDKAYDLYSTKWPEAGTLSIYHVHVVHLWDDLEQAIKHQAICGGEILEINLPDDDCEYIRMDDLESSCVHPVSYLDIPCEYIRRI